MSKEPEAEEGAAGEAPKKKGKKKLILIVVGLLVVVLGVGAPMILMKGTPKEEDKEEQQEEPQKLKLADLGIFIVNLSETSAFLKVNIKVEYDEGLLEKLASGGGEGGGEGHGGGYAGGGEEGGSGGGLPPKLKEREAVIRDAIIRVLSARKTEDVLSVDGKSALKEEIIEALNDASGLEQPVVTNVYFSEFIVQ